ncbi:hypothetical protein [Burkholderia multivorans]|uniref:hypothetical protein n=1 Tax=Burkholderia multivorans TaxID=87883 RepID=UPI00208EDB70|nr:hypothetical protein [Burkholderia multivorans]MCO1445308.1 hypothetical protein [Burkholderia multivorans]
MKKNRKEAAASLLTDMEATAARMRELIVAMPPHDLLGYIYAQRMIKAMGDQSDTQDQYEADGPDDLINEKSVSVGVRARGSRVRCRPCGLGIRRSQVRRAI